MKKGAVGEKDGNKTSKWKKENKEKLDNDFKQSIEGLSIVGTAANNKKK